jgi:ABC-type multidrug transport system fused ATPase/permease subunit
MSGRQRIDAGGWRGLGALLRPYGWTVSAAAIAMVLDAGLTVMRPWPLKIVIDRVVSSSPRTSRVPLIGAWLDSSSLDRISVLYAACGATLMIAVGTGLLTYVYTRTLGIVAQKFMVDLRARLFAHMQRLSLRFHDGQRTGDLITRLTSDVQAIQDALANGTIILGSSLFLLLGMVGMMLWLNWRFALAALAVAPLLFLSVFLSTRRIRTASREARASTGVLASLAQETLSSIRIVQGLGQEGRQDERFQLQAASGQQAYLDIIRYQARVAPLVDVLAAAGLTTVMWYGATRVIAGELTIGDIVVFFAYVTNLYSPMKALARLSVTLNKATVGAERITDVLRVQSEVTDRKGARSVCGLRGAVTFSGVSFAYESARPVLSEVSFDLAPGERVAIVGATGAGKSTLLSLIPRLYDPTAGSVCIDGQDIRTFSLQSLRKHISLVLQDPLLFSGTIRDNIAFGRPDASDADIIGAALTAHADGFIQRFPNGYDTIVSERGSTLSGGQKQRIAIARAIVRAAPILLLDEPTSGLDVTSERLVIDALERAALGRTTLIIAHRLATLRLVHRIMVMDAGRIIEVGTHAELLARNGRYASLCRVQFGSTATSPLGAGIDREEVGR